MGLNIHAQRPLTYFPPTSGVTPPDETRAPRVDGVGIAEAGQVKEAQALDANIIELGESQNLSARDECVAKAPGTNSYQWKFGEKQGEGQQHYGYDSQVAFVNYNRFDSNSTLYGVNGTAGSDPLAKCRQMLIG